MIAYKNLDDICEGLSVWSLLNDEGHAKLKKCVKVYWDTYYNPPVGVVGVGRITYAEQQLVLAQEVTHDCI